MDLVARLLRDLDAVGDVELGGSCTKWRAVA
jgi:hypothetical protein